MTRGRFEFLTRGSLRPRSDTFRVCFRVCLRVCLGVCLLVSALGVLPSCGDPAVSFPHADLMLRVSADRERVRTGEAVTLTVVRTWHDNWTPRPFDDGAFTPLVLRALETRTERDGAYTQETRRFRAHVFSVDDVMLRSPRFAAVHSDGVTKRIAKAPPFLIRVRSGLTPESAQTPELPRGPVLEPQAPAPWHKRFTWLAAVATLGVALSRTRRPRRRGDARSDSKPHDTPSSSPLAQLQQATTAAAESIPATGPERARQLLALGEALRTALGATYGVETLPLTPKECVAAIPQALTTRDFLVVRERIVFGGWQPSHADSAAALADLNQALLALRGAA